MNQYCHLFPLGQQVNLADLERCPYPIFQQLRRDEPVSWIDEVAMWFVTGYDDCKTILLDTQTFTLEDDESLLHDIFGKTMISSDGPEHSKLRQPFHPPFLPKVIHTTMSSVIEDRANHLIDGFTTQGECDLVGQWADKLALEMVMRVLGLPIHDHTVVRRWFSEIGQGLANFKRHRDIKVRGQAAAGAFTDYARPHLEQLKVEPDDSVLGSLVTHGADLSDEEILAACRVIVFGGLETTAALLANTVWALLTHPEQLGEVQRDLTLLSKAAEETLRWEAPVQTLTRRATRRVTLRGVTIEAGQTVQCMIGAANRDETYYADAETFTIHRDQTKGHLSFAIGKHYCLGAALARLEAQIGLRVLFERLPDLHFVPEKQADAAPRGYEFRSPPALWLRWQV
jgi:cytochrome P450